MGVGFFFVLTTTHIYIHIYIYIRFPSAKPVVFYRETYGFQLGKRWFFVVLSQYQFFLKVSCFYVRFIEKTGKFAKTIDP